MAKKVLTSLFIIMLSAIGLTFGYSEVLTTNLQSAGIDIPSLEAQKSVLRYETARLLNAVDCKDCLVPDDRIQSQYNRQFWTVFSQQPDFNFSDIRYLNAKRDKKDYFYCVAYVAENEYLRGYPSTSATCKNKFCGNQAITKSEFFQAILNLVDSQIFPSFSANRGEIKSWFSSLQPTSYIYQTFTTKEIQTIQKASNQSGPLQSVDQLSAYMRYCTFHLDKCGFQSIANLKEGRRPIAELNVLMKAGIITSSETNNLYSSINGEEILKILDYVSSQFVSCKLDKDYDCDGIKNIDDNCPNTYNPNQYDLDGDGIGNVCDADIDGDGNMNPIGIVDDDDHIIIPQRDPSLDNTPLGENRDGLEFFVKVDSINGFTVSFKLLSSSSLKSSTRTFGDGKKQLSSMGNTISHTYSNAGSYTIRVIGTTQKGQKAEASMNVYLAPEVSNQYFLSLKPSFTIKNAGIDYTTTAINSGRIDRIVWTVNDVVQASVKNNMTISVSKDGSYLIRAKAYRGNQIVAIAQNLIIHSSIPAFASLNLQSPSLQGPTTANLTLVGRKFADVKQVLRDRGDGSAFYTTGLSATHQFQTSGLKSLSQTIYFSDGKSIPIISTVYIQNPLISKSLYLNPNGVDLRVEKEENRCISLFNQGQSIKKLTDICYDALRAGTLSQFKNDLDKDGIPDICDDDIDGDGKKNLLGLILKDNDDGSFDASNVSLTTYQRHIDVCSLDNAPFTSNTLQTDLNKNGIGDAGEIVASNILGKNILIMTGTEIKNGDSALDLTIPEIIDDSLCDTPISSYCGNGIIDSAEDCRNCPEDVGKCISICGDLVVDPGETCKNCPEDAGKCTSICGDGVIDLGETCKSCPEDVPDCDTPLITGFNHTGTDAKCGNGVIDKGETCKNCPWDVQRCATKCGNGIKEDLEECDNGKANGPGNTCSKTCKNQSGEDGGGNPKIKPAQCNVCPCEYVDTAGAFKIGDTIRAKLWDKSSGAIYNFSSNFTTSLSLG